MWGIIEGECLRHPSPRTMRKRLHPATNVKKPDSAPASVAPVSAPSSASSLGYQNQSVFGGVPQFPNPISRTSFSTVDSLSGSMSSVDSHLTQGTSQSTDKLLNGSLVGPPLPFVSKDYTSTKSSEPVSPSSMEELLERQWEQGSNFLMQQGQHFDIASLLSCLHQLKTENNRLETYIGTLLSRRDHLLAVNARLSMPFNPGQGPHPGGDNPGDIPTKGVGLNSSHTMNGDSSSEDNSDDSHINVVDTPSGSGSTNSPITSYHHGNTDSARHQLFPTSSSQVVEFSLVRCRTIPTS